MKSWLTGFLYLLLCVPTVGAEELPTDRVARLVAVEPTHLNPLFQPDVWAYRIAHDLICEPLVRRTEHDARVEYQPVLAERFRLDREGRTLDVWLRKGVRFHDGRPLHSYDVQLSLQMVLAQAEGTETRSLLRNVQKITRTGPDTLRFTLRFGNAQILDALSELSIVPAAYFPDGRLPQKPFHRKPVCTGPFRFVEWKRNQQVVLRRNPVYWGSAPPLDELRFLFAADAAKAFHLFRSGQADALLRVPLRYIPELVEPAVARGRFAKLVPEAKQVVTLVYNGRRPLLSLAAVRQALAGFLDPQTLVREVRHGLGSFEMPLPRPARFTQPQAEKVLDDQKISRAAPGSARLWNGRLVVFKLLFPSHSPELRDLAARCAAAFDKLGIQTVPEAIEPAVFLSRLRQGGFDLALLAWNYTGSDRLFDPGPLLNLAYPAQHPIWNTLASKLLPWQNGVDAEGLRSLWQIEQPITLLYRTQQLVLVRPGVTAENRNGFLDFRTLSLANPNEQKHGP